jgi:hypothetical protein
MNKFVTFSIDKNDSDCYEKTIANTKLIGTAYYKGWKSCVCVGNDAPQEYIQQLAKTADRLIFINHNNASLMLEKLFPVFEEHVECFVSRSCNSVISFKESRLIESWIEGEKQLCLIREEASESIDVRVNIFGAKQTISRLVQSQLQNIYNNRTTNLNVNFEEFYNQHSDSFFSGSIL